MHAALPLPEARVDSSALLDPDVSALEFNLRVLALAEGQATPLLERLNYLAIVSANLDEFFMVNVGALKGRLSGGEGRGRLDARGTDPRRHRVRQDARRTQRLVEASDRPDQRARLWRRVGADVDL